MPSAVADQSHLYRCLLLRRRFLQFVEQRVEQPDQVAAAANRECVVAGRNSTTVLRPGSVTIRVSNSPSTAVESVPTWFPAKRSLVPASFRIALISPAVRSRFRETLPGFSGPAVREQSGSDRPLPSKTVTSSRHSRKRFLPPYSRFSESRRLVVWAQDGSAIEMRTTARINVVASLGLFIGWSVVPNVRAAFGQQFPQHRSVATALVGAVAANREIGRVRQSGE